LKGQWKSTGDPTEVALQVFAGKLGLGRPDLTGEGPEVEERTLRPAMGKVIDYGVPEKDRDVQFAPDSKEETQKRRKKDARFELKAEFPFSSELKRMTTIYTDKEDPENAYILIKGAVSLLVYTLLRMHLTGPVLV
jgi:P-type Na+/K+ transporter